MRHQYALREAQREEGGHEAQRPPALPHARTGRPQDGGHRRSGQQAPDQQGARPAELNQQIDPAVVRRGHDPARLLAHPVCGCRLPDPAPEGPVAVAGPWTVGDLAHQAVPDFGPAGQRRVLAEGLEHGHGMGVPDPEAQPAEHHSDPDQHNREGRATAPHAPETADHGQTDQEAKQRGLGLGRQDKSAGQDQRSRRHQPARVRRGETGGGGRRADDHDGPHLVLLVPETAPEAGIVDLMHADRGEGEDHHQTADRHEQRRLHQQARQMRPAEDRAEIEGKTATHGEGDHPAHGGGEIKRPVARGEGQPDQGDDGDHCGPGPPQPVDAIDQHADDGRIGGQPHQAQNRRLQLRRREHRPDQGSGQHRDDHAADHPFPDAGGRLGQDRVWRGFAHAPKVGQRA